MHVTEPMTLVTDYLLAGESILLALSLLLRSRAAGRGAVGLWGVAFLVGGLAALAGGTAHGFRLHLGEANWSVVWNLTVGSIGASAVLMLAAGIRSVLRSEASGEAERQAGVGYLKKGILVSLVGLSILLGKLSLHRHLNQNELYHLVQMLGLFLFYRGALLLHGLEVKKSPKT